MFIINFDFFFLQDNIIIEDLLKTSKILASSTSPPDSITAGYLLEVVIFLKHNSKLVSNY